MDVRKNAGAERERGVDERELALINAQSRKTLSAEEVYAFGVRLCDNEIDRDGERFTEGTLEELAKLFVGKSGIFDHQWSAKGQAARIYRAEVVREEGAVTGAGDPCSYLKGWAYMVRTEGNADLIAEIDGGIKREVSVGCAVKQAVCSICGEDMGDRSKCAHVKGQRYGGKLCWADLTGATDAYEWSFVAVPAQKRAGVMKGAKNMRRGEKEMELKEFLRERPEYLAQVERLEGEAEAGRRYLASLRREVARLGGLAEPGMDAAVLGTIADKLSEEELGQMKKAYEARLDGKYPAGPQLRYAAGKGEESGKDGAFLI